VHMALGYGQLLRMRIFLAYSLPVAFGAAAIFAYQTEAPVLLIDKLHVSAAAYGIYGAMPALGFIAGGFITRKLAGKVSRGMLMQLGCALCTLAGIVLTVLALAMPLTALAIAAPMILFGMGNGIVMPNGGYGAMRAAPAMIGASAALSSCMRMGSGSLGSLLATCLPDGSVLALGLLVTAGGLAAFLTWRVLGRGLD
jgi:MFS transporter, DHA1 family, multidrug resistance protein